MKVESKAKRSIIELPTEILERILLLSLNPSVPQTCKLFNYITSNTFFKVNWLLLRYKGNAKKALINGMKWSFYDINVMNKLEEMIKMKEGINELDTRETKRPRYEGKNLTKQSSDTNINYLTLYDSASVPKHLFNEGERRLEKLQFLKQLIERKVSLEKNGGIGLVLSCKNKNYEMVKLLLASKIDPNYKDGLPLRIAAKNGDQELANILLEYSVELTSKAVKMAVMNKKHEFAEFMITKGAVPDMETVKMLI